MNSLISLCCCLGLAVVAPAPAVADVRALLVGVSDYRYLDADLRGPANDVRLMAETLGARGAEHITVLADPGARLPVGLDRPREPTRDAILSALADLAGAAGPDDTVFFYFSGHGSQAPDRNGDEAGGYDEILLPSDAKNWRGAIGDVENAIVDDEFQPLFQAILDTGATLIAVIDACHSATGFRAAKQGAGAERFLSAAALGVPEDAVPSGDGGVLSPPLRGNFAFLYSSQANQRSFEFPLGDANDPDNWYGGFTAALSGVLQSEDTLSWAQAVRGAADTLRRGEAAQTPDAEGPALDTAVFGAAGSVQRRVAFEDLAVRAGLLHGLTEGTTVAVYDSAASTRIVATATLSDLSATSAILRSVDPLPRKGYVSPIAPGLPAPFRIAPPVVLDSADYGPILDLLAAQSAAGLPEGVEWNAAVPDAVPVLRDGVLALAGAEGLLDPAGPGSSPRMTGDPVMFFEAASRTHRLRRALALAENVRRTGFSLSRSPLRIEIEREAGRPSADGCTTSGEAASFDTDQPVGQCDRLWLTMGNTSTTPQDVTVLYLDRDFGITALWPDPGLSNRILFNETQEAGLEIRLRDDLPGFEEIIVIAVPGSARGGRTVLTGLADPVATRSASGGGALENFLWAASDPTARTRAFGAASGMAAPQITRLRLTLAPTPPPPLK